MVHPMPEVRQPIDVFKLVNSKLGGNLKQLHASKCIDFMITVYIGRVVGVERLLTAWGTHVVQLCTLSLPRLRLKLVFFEQVGERFPRCCPGGLLAELIQHQVGQYKVEGAFVRLC